MGALALCLFAGVEVAEPGVEPRLREPAPDFTLPGLKTGKPRSLRHYRGKVLVLTMFGTWCKPCRKELRLVDEWLDSRRLAGRADSVAVLSVGRGESREKVAAFVEDLDLGFPILLDAGKSTYAAYPSYVPLLYIIDEEGVLVDAASGWEGDVKAWLESTVRCYERAWARKGRPPALNPE
jgi:peroxiredoxin